MNKRQIVASLNSIANELDSKGLFKEANEVTEVMVRLSQASGVNETRQGHPSLFSIEDQAKKDIKRKIDAKDIEGAKTIYRETLRKLKDPSNFIREVSPTINDPSVPIASLEPMPPYDLVPDSPKPNTPRPDSDSLGPKIKMPYDIIPGLGSKPEDKPESLSPKKSEGLSRWVNKAENIYSAWVSKGARPSTDAEGLIQDIIDYMEKVKLNMRPSLHSAADYKIDKVKALKLAISSGITMPSSAITTPYGAVSGFPGKGVNPFTYDPSKRLTGNALDYQARQEGKSI